MANTSRDQRYPEHARAATSYVLVPNARNLSRAGTKREARWPIIVKYDGDPNGVALAKRDGGVTKRHLHMLERHGLLRFNTSPEGDSRPAPVTPLIAVLPESDESRYPEGAQSFRLHRHLERDGNLPTRAKERRLEEVGTLECDTCGFNFSRIYGELGEGFIEAHHTVPISEMTVVRNTKLEELALVCSNCHRMLHRGTRLMTVSELRSMIGSHDET
jgi:HNH endonuclease